MNTDLRTDEQLDERLRSGFARLAAAVPMMRRSGAQAGGVANVRVAARPRARFRSGAGAMVGALALLAVAVAVATGMLANRPAVDRGVAASAATSVTSSTADETIRLTVTAARGQFVAGEPIDVTATLAYSGPAPTLEVGTSSGVVGFGVAEVGGTRHTSPVSDDVCSRVLLERGSPATYPFVKSGGYAADSTDPNDAFVKDYLNIANGRPDPVLRLPAGTWKVFAQVDLSEGTCGNGVPRHQLEASVLITVTAAPAATLAAPATGAPTPDPSAGRGWVRIETLDLAAGLHGTAHVIGAAAGGPTQPCTADYEAVASVVDGVLQVGVIEHAHPGPSPTSGVVAACDAMGYARVATFELAAPYTGSKWRDLAGYSRLLFAPARTATLPGLPAGWTLRIEEDMPERSTGGWRSVWERPGLSDPARRLSLYQLFGAPAGLAGEGSPTTVQVNGRPATLYGLDAGSTMWLVLWRLGEDGMALEAPQQDFSKDEVIRLAESVTAP